MKNQRTLTTMLLSASILGMAPAVFAQNSGDEVIVTGIRQSLENALNEKREATSLVEVILAEDIGKLPDQNLAEVLENVTGIQITREAGVGTGVQIRGSNENRIEINGVTTVGSGNGRGGINFEDVSAAIIAGVEVIKAPESSTIEGAVGGTINLRTIRALDLDEDDTLASVRFQLEDANLSNDGLQPRIEGTLGKKWSNASGQEIGFVASASYTEQDSSGFRTRAESEGREGIRGGFDFLNPQFFVQEIENFETENFNFAGSVEARPTQNIKLFFDAIVNTQERRQESSRVQFSGIANSDAAEALAADPATVFETVDFGSLDGVELGTIDRAVLGTLVVQDDLTDGNIRTSSDTNSRLTDTNIFRLGGEWDVSERLSARAEFSDSSADTESPSFNTTLNFINPNVALDLDQLRANFASGTGNTSNDNGTAFLFDLRNDELSFGISPDTSIGGATTEDLLNPDNYVLEQVAQNFDVVENSETALRFDVSYDLEDVTPFITSVDAGYRYNETSSDLVDVDNSTSFRSIDQAASGDLFADLLVAGPNNFGDAGGGRDLFVSDFLLINQELSNSDPAQVLAALNAATAANNAAFGFDQPLFSRPAVDQLSSFTIEEETHAIYGQANFEYGILRGNAGLRYVETDVTSIGTEVLNGVPGEIVSTSSYDFLLPRVNLILEPVEDVVIRAAWSEDINRPGFSSLQSSISFATSPNPSVSQGNVELAPQEITNFDVGADWYFAPAAVFSVGYFRKERDGLFVPQTSNPVETFTEVTLADGTTVSAFVRDVTDPCEGGGIFNPIADRNVFAPLDPVTGAEIGGTGVCVPFSTTVNDTGTTTQQGVEVAFQYDLSSWEDKLGWASGFGFLANYTYQEFSGGATTLSATSRGAEVLAAASGGATNVTFTNQLLDNSEHAYNLTAFYEKYGLSARARYTWRDAFRTLDTAAGASLGSTLGFPPVTDSRGQLNASINYDVTEHLNVGVDAVNLFENDVTQRCVNEGGPVCFENLSERRVIFGASYTF